MSLIDFLSQPWPWYVSGPLLGLTIPLLLFFGNKQFGVSTSLQHICAATVKPKAEYFRYDWKAQAWNLVFVAGLFVGGAVAVLFLGGGGPPQVSAAATELFGSWGLSAPTELLPRELFALENLFTLRSLVVLGVGGFLVGFGARYAGGCTSGHAIMGVSLLNLGSIVAVIAFFVGGLFMSRLLLPLILGM